MRFIRLCTVNNSIEAKLIKNNLASQGIPCIVTNENVTSLLPHMNGILGSGIQILVDKNDFEKAFSVVHKNAKNDSIKCYHCGSNNIRYGLGTTSRTSKLVALILAIVIGSPTSHVQQTYYCNDCKTEFQ